jgi:hypothetical protein
MFKAVMNDCAKEGKLVIWTSPLVIRKAARGHSNPVEDAR